MENVKIILICGRARTGKNTLAGFIKKHASDESIKTCEIQMMRTLKGYLKDYFGWDGRDETKPRDFLQKFATEVIRDKMNLPQFHIDRLDSDIRVLSNYFNLFIVDDIRYPKEIEEFRNRFDSVYVIKLNRENYDDLMTEEERNHITEHALDDYNNYDKIINNTSLEELENIAKQIVREVIKNEIHD